ncbi:MAG: DUF3572 domain-containing protein [Alphaproteobacteria bacterium]
MAKMTETDAISLAQQAVIFLSQDEELLGRFLALSGIGPAEIRGRIGDPAFLAGIMDFLLAHEPSVLAFAAWADIDPALPGQARVMLPGYSHEN